MNIKKIIINSEYHKFYPNLDNLFYGSNGIYRIKTNSYGFRTNEFSKKKYKKNYLFLGDSFIAPDNISNDNSFIKIFEKNKKNCIAYNLGVDASGTDQQLNIYKKYKDKIHYDELIICLNPENIFRNLRKEMQFKINSNYAISFKKDFYYIKGDQIKYHKISKTLNSYDKFEKVAISKLNIFLKKKLSIKNYCLLRKIFKKDIFSIYNLNSYEWSLLKKILLEFRKITDKKINLILIPHPQHYFGVSSMKNILKCFDTLKNKNFNVINLNDYLSSFSSSELNKLSINKFDYHFSNYGHKIISKFFINNF